MEIKSVGIIGAGTMGQGIAQVCASAGFKVLLYDVQPSATASALKKIGDNLASLVAKGKMTTDEERAISSRITTAEELKMLNCDLIIEAAVENLDIKRKIFREIEGIVGKEGILTSNTSSISITQIATSLKNRDRFAGLHFFNPAPAMKLVEVIKAAQTSDATVAALQVFCKRIQKHAVVAQDSPGFIVNRVARQFYVESLKLAEEGVSNIETIDQLLRASGFRMGAFELMDLIGIDVNFAVTQSLYNGFHQAPRFRPSKLQEQKVDTGDFGRKTGKGFYVYNN